MERLETKKIGGHVYYYYSHWGWVNGKCKRLWQKYLGKLEDIAKACEGGGQSPVSAEIFEWGLPTALWRECSLAKVIEEVDALCPKRRQGLSTGRYLAIAAINRAIRPNSKRSMWEWFSQTTLLRNLPEASKEALCSQRFWDHMDKLEVKDGQQIWKNIFRGVVEREALDISSIAYDGTNFYTFIDTFNQRCQIAKRGKNKQGQYELRQVSYALFCSADAPMPLFYDVYEGNRHDAKEFPLILEKFNAFLKEISAKRCAPANITLIFDKGNNSESNFILIDEMGLNFVCSEKLDLHKELTEIPNNDPRFIACEQEGLDGTKALRVKKKLHGKERIVVVTFSSNLFNTQWQTVQADINKALDQLGLMRQKLQDREAGIVRGGKLPSVSWVQAKCEEILSRPFMRRVIKLSVAQGPQGIPQLQYIVDSAILKELADTYLGKNILITSQHDWDNDRIIKAYRSQSVIENVFKEMKDRQTGSWWPMNHWTDSKIMVHGLYCTIALLLRALMLRRLTTAKIRIPMGRLLSELDNIREVVNFYPKSRRQKLQRSQSVLTKTSELQKKIIETLELRKGEKNEVLG